MKTTAVTISVRWGSDFQKEVGEKTLMQILETWKQGCEEHHRSTSSRSILENATSDQLNVCLSLISTAPSLMSLQYVEKCTKVILRTHLADEPNTSLNPLSLTDDRWL